MIRQIEKYEERVADIYTQLEELKSDVYEISVDAGNNFLFASGPDDDLWEQDGVVAEQASAVYDKLENASRYVDDWMEDIGDLKKMAKKHRR